MEAKSDKSTAKKFSFRKRRSSKGKKESDVPPVDSGPEQEGTELVHEQTPESKASVSVELEQTPVEEDRATQSCGEDSAPKSDDSPPGEASKKKKSKRRSWFKGSSKKSSEKVEDGSELEVKENAEQKGEAASEGIEVVEEDVKSSTEQVVCEESGKHGEITDQSDGEGYLSLGEASEAEGAEGKGSSPEPATADDKGTKRKGFFKRGLSLKRRKSKKQMSEAKEAEVQTNEAELQTESTEQTSEINEENKAEAITEQNEDTKDIEQSKAEADTSSAVAKTSPVKPPRKVSFLGPDGKKLESSDDGDSLTEHVTETGDESDQETVTAEDGPSEDETVVAEDGANEGDAVTTEVEQNGDLPEIVVVMSEDAGCSDALTEGDDDDLTEVSSMSSSLLASSSDAPDTISTSDASRLFVFTDTDDTGSRITLTEISEESEAESKPEVDDNVPKCESKPEVANEESGTESKPEDSDEKTGFESRPEATETDAENEATKLLDNGEKGKAAEWEMVDRSYDMSVELQRVRKQTLFSVKRLCCSVM